MHVAPKKDKGVLHSRLQAKATCQSVPLVGELSPQDFLTVNFLCQSHHLAQFGHPAVSDHPNWQNTDVHWVKQQQHWLANQTRRFGRADFDILVLSHPLLRCRRMIAQKSQNNPRILVCACLSLASCPCAIAPGHANKRPAGCTAIGTEPIQICMAPFVARAGADPEPGSGVAAILLGLV